MMGRDVVRPAATRGDGVPAGVQDHASDPRADGENSIHDGALDQRFKRSTQDVKKVSEIHSGDVVSGREHRPADHRGSKHLDRAIQKAANGNQHENHEEAIGSRIALERVVLQARNAIRREERANHYNDQERAGVKTGPDGWMFLPVDRVRMLLFGYRILCHDAGELSAGTPLETTALAELSLPERSTAVTV